MVGEELMPKVYCEGSSAALLADWYKYILAWAEVQVFLIAVVSSHALQM